MSDWPGGEWGNDWNHNGEYDSYDRYMDYEMYVKDEPFEEDGGGGSYGSCGSSSGYGSSGSSLSGKSYLIAFGVAIVLAIINETLGALFLLGFLYYDIFLK